MKGISNFIYLITLIAISGCLSKPIPIISLPEDNIKNKNLFIFFDGTANDPSSNTNVWQLHNLITNETKKNKIGTFYIEGVGAKNKVIGMALGWGTGYRVEKAYSFLSENYMPGDKIYLIGFSRGAYQARILASMLYFGGLPEESITQEDSDEVTEKVYNAFKGEMDSLKRRQQISKVANLTPVTVDFLGLWDTVEALGVPDYEEDTSIPNLRYGDQLCNVKQAFHALSLDDNRANIFTPILLTNNHLLSNCDIEMDGMSRNDDSSIAAQLNSKVEEVWFSGAHADVGGGYDDSNLNGVSLNWMIKQINQSSPLLLVNAKAHLSDPNGKIHEPESETAGVAIYLEKMRSLYSYTGSTLYNDGYLKVHHTAIERLRKPEKINENDEERKSQWWLVEQFPRCFKENSFGGYIYKGINQRGCNLEVVYNSEKMSKKLIESDML